MQNINPSPVETEFFDVTFSSMSGDYKVRVDPNSTLESVTREIAHNEAFDSTPVNVYYSGRPLFIKRSFKENQVANNSKIDMTYVIYGG